MPYSNIEKAKEVWQKTKQIIKDGAIVKGIKNNIRQTNFPNKKFNPISHRLIAFKNFFRMRWLKIKHLDNMK